MGPSAGAAARLPEKERQDLAVLARAIADGKRPGGLTFGELQVRLSANPQGAGSAGRRFHGGQLGRGGAVELAVSKIWLRQAIVGLALICHGSYRGIIAFLRDLLGVAISIGTVHDVLQSVTQQADVINRQQDLSGIRVGLHDEIFHGGKPVAPAHGARHCRPK